MSNPGPQHAAIGQIAVQDNCMEFGGMALTRLVQRVGTTPFYAYDRRQIRERVLLLRQHLPEAIQIHYALKANPMPAVVHHVASLVDGMDVASGQELATALNTGMPPERVSFAGPGKSDAELSCAVAAGVLINLESEEEMRRVVRISDRLRIAALVAIRVNPDFELKHSGMKMGGGPKQFGVDAERVPDMLKELGSSGLRFQGFHFYAGSQILNADAINEAFAKTISLATDLAQHAPDDVRLLNLGGGFGIPYFAHEQPLDISRVGAFLHQQVSIVQKALPQATLVTELGRYLVGEAGIYVCRVLEKKTSRGQTYLITDGGMHHHLAATGNFGQVLRKNYPVLIGNRASESSLETVSIVGPLCTPLDVLAERIELPRAEVGDLVVVLQSGAYGSTASPAAFLSHPLAREVLI